MQLTPETLELNKILEEVENSNRTYKLDFTKNRITSEIDNIEALKQTIYCILNTERYENLIYSWNYGSELKALVGKDKDFVIGDLKRRITEALLVDDRINAIDNFEYKVDKNTLIVNFRVFSIYGEISITQEVTVQ